MSERGPVDEEKGENEPDFILSRELLDAAKQIPHPAGDLASTRFLGSDMAPEVFIRGNISDEAWREESLDILPPLTEPERQKYLEERRSRLREAYGELNQQGIEVLPFALVEHQDQILLITRKVHGEPLLQALKHNSEEVGPVFDRLAVASLHYVQNVAEAQKPYLYDALGWRQYMYGTYQGDNGHPRPLFVDIDPFDEALVDPKALDDPPTFGLMRQVAQDIVQVLQIDPSVSMTESSSALIKAIDEAINDPDNDPELKGRFEELRDDFLRRDFAALLIGLDDGDLDDGDVRGDAGDKDA
jgi:hypothetical protein